MSAEHSPAEGESRRNREMEVVARGVVEKLQRAGHTAYFAGGCVRDLVMGRQPHDFDVATSARPDQVASLFRRTQQVGAKFGVVLVKERRQAVEVATFRTDHAYSDGRRPDEVSFSSPEEDAQRRDFTVNGMFYDPVSARIIDYVGGQADISNRLIRAIGDPELRFSEDHLRLMRAIRFAGRLDFEIEASTWSAIQRHASDICKISPERVRMELEMMLSSPSRGRALQRLSRSGLLTQLWENPETSIPSIEAAQGRVDHLPDGASHELAFAALTADGAPEAASSALESLRASNHTIDRVIWLLSHQRDFEDASALEDADLKFLMANPGFQDLADLIKSRLVSTSAPMEEFDSVMKRAAAIAPEAVAPIPFVNGNDLKQFGAPAGPVYKRTLAAIYRAQLNGKLDSREAGLEMAKRLLSAE